MLTCFKEIYLSFPNVAGMEFALMYPAAPVEHWKSGVYERVGVKLTHFGRFRRNKEAPMDTPDRSCQSRVGV